MQERIKTGDVEQAGFKDTVWSGINDAVKAYKTAVNEQTLNDAGEALKSWFDVFKQMGYNEYRNAVDFVNKALNQENSAKAIVR